MVALDPDDAAFGAFERAAGYSDGLAFGELHGVILEVVEALFSGGGHKAEDIELALVNRCRSPEGFAAAGIDGKLAPEVLGEPAAVVGGRADEKKAEDQRLPYGPCSGFGTDYALGARNVCLKTFRDKQFLYLEGFVEKYFYGVPGDLMFFHSSYEQLVD